jgi:dTDP-4-amino-4,6-dideoxygalactose transaminase
VTSDDDPADSDASASAGGWVRAGAAGDVGCFSFYPTKNLAALGDAGAVSTDDAETAERLRSLRNHGRGPEGGGRHAEAAWNTRLDELQAAVLREKLEVLEEWNGRRRRHARAYDRAFDDLDGIEPPPVAPGNRHVYHQYTVRCEDRDAVAEALSERGVGHGVYYPVPLHRQPALAGRHGAGDASGRVGADAAGGGDGAAGGGVAGGGERSGRPGEAGAEGAPTGSSFPEAELAAREVLSLPVFPLLEDEERERVIEAVRDAVA